MKNREVTVNTSELAALYELAKSCSLRVHLLQRILIKNFPDTNMAKIDDLAIDDFYKIYVYKL